MNQIEQLPIITELNPEYGVAVQAVRHILEPFLSDPNIDPQDLIEQCPLIQVAPIGEAPCDVHFFLCCAFWENAFRFFYSMIRRWLIPGKELNISMQFAIDFRLPTLSQEKFIAAKITLQCANALDRAVILKNLPSLLGELRFGLHSPHQANRVLETRGLSYDEKIAFVQSKISQLIKSRPQHFDYDILNDMQRFLVFCKEDFKLYRTVSHLTRIICVQYLFRKSLQQALAAMPGRRYINVKFLYTRLQDHQKVLGIAIALSFLKENEIFEARHILGAIKAIVPHAQKVEHSFYVPPQGIDGIYFLYIEVEKPAAHFTLHEIHSLKKDLPGEIKARIEQRHNPIFMPQNEEMVMRHIVTLTGQLTSVKDLPQVIIDFSTQTERHIEFLVILVRVKTLSLPSIRHLFELRGSNSVTFRFDRQKVVGILRNKYKKEASVFRLSLDKHPFLRWDHSVDLYKARQVIVQELKGVIGEFRDYNGGSIAKEMEVFDALKLSLGESEVENHFLLENLFFSLHPPVMRSVLPPETLARLFRMVIDARIDGLPQEEEYQIRIEEDRSNYFLLAMTREIAFLSKFLDESHELLMDSNQIVTCLIEETGLFCFGVICRNHDPEEVRSLWYLLEKTLEQATSPESRLNHA